MESKDKFRRIDLDPPHPEDFPSDSTTGQFIRAGPTHMEPVQNLRDFLGAAAMAQRHPIACFPRSKSRGSDSTTASLEDRSVLAAQVQTIFRRANLARDEKRIPRPGKGGSQTKFRVKRISRRLRSAVMPPGSWNLPARECSAEDRSAITSSCSVCSKLSRAPKRRAAARNIASGQRPDASLADGLLDPTVFSSG